MMMYLKKAFTLTFFKSTTYFCLYLSIFPTVLIGFYNNSCQKLGALSYDIKNWVSQGDLIYKAALPNAILKEYNPYEDEIFGDWYDSFGQVHHTGEIFVDDEALYEAPDLNHMKQ